MRSNGLKIEDDANNDHDEYDDCTRDWCVFYLFGVLVCRTAVSQHTHSNEEEERARKNSFRAATKHQCSELDSFKIENRIGLWRAQNLRAVWRSLSAFPSPPHTHRSPPPCTSSATQDAQMSSSHGSWHRWSLGLIRHVWKSCMSTDTHKVQSLLQCCPRRSTAKGVTSDKH